MKFVLNQRLAAAKSVVRNARHQAVQRTREPNRLVRSLVQQRGRKHAPAETTVDHDLRKVAGLRELKYVATTVATIEVVVGQNAHSEPTAMKLPQRPVLCVTTMTRTGRSWMIGFGTTKKQKRRSHLRRQRLMPKTRLTTKKRSFLRVGKSAATLILKMTQLAIRKSVDAVVAVVDEVAVVAVLKMEPKQASWKKRKTPHPQPALMMT